MERNPHEVKALYALLGGIIFASILMILFTIAIQQNPPFAAFLAGTLGVFILVLIGLHIYARDKPELHETLMTGWHNAGVFLTKLGIQFNRNINTSWESEAKERKKRVPLTAKQKEEVMSLNDGACMKCGRDVPLEIHHVDGNPSNNNIKNLMCICGTCHSEINSLPIAQVKAIRNNPRKAHTTIIKVKNKN